MVGTLIRTDTIGEVNRIFSSIIVSQWVGFLNVVELHLERKGIQYTSITGQVPICDRTERMEKFNRPGGPTVIFTLNT